MAAVHEFPDVSLLITHYNRSSSLQRLLQSFRALNCTFGGIIVSDDGSKPEHQAVLENLKKEYDFQLVTTPKNKGLGNNINKGQDAVTTPYTLYVQEDFVPKPAFPVHFRDALNFMQEDRELDIVRFYAYFRYPYLEPYGKGFSKMVFKAMPWFSDHLKFYYYSDHPHLRRSSFFRKFGRYLEGKNGDITEFTMCLSFLKNGGKGLFFEQFTDVFDQMNTSSEPSTATFRADWRQSQKPHVLLMRWAYLKYRFVKNSLELLNTKPHYADSREKAIAE